MASHFFLVLAYVTPLTPDVLSERKPTVEELTDTRERDVEVLDSVVVFIYIDVVYSSISKGQRLYGCTKPDDAHTKAFAGIGCVYNPWATKLIPATLLTETLHAGFFFQVIIPCSAS